MRKIGALSVAGTLSLLLVGCGAEGEQVNEGAVVQEEIGTTDASNTEQSANASNPLDMQEMMDELEYAEFELEVEYAGDTEYEVEIEQKNVGTVKARIEDSLNHVEKNGADAISELQPLVQKLTITKESNRDEVISEVLTTFNLPTEYTNFDLEITFNDGTKVEFEDK